jgi:hypothetical protein
MSYLSKFVTAFMILVIMALLASQQLFLFSDPLAAQWDRSHLWFALTAIVVGCFAAALMFHFFLRHERAAWSRVAPTFSGPPFNELTPNIPAISPTLATFVRIRQPTSQWLTEGQSDDRTPENGSVARSERPPSAQRAFARASHQLMFKKWSQARHD